MEVSGRDRLHMLFSGFHGGHDVRKRDLSSTQERKSELSKRVCPCLQVLEGRPFPRFPEEDPVDKLANDEDQVVLPSNAGDRDWRYLADHGVEREALALTLTIAR